MHTWQLIKDVCIEKSLELPRTGVISPSRRSVVRLTALQGIQKNSLAKVETR